MNEQMGDQTVNKNKTKTISIILVIVIVLLELGYVAAKWRMTSSSANVQISSKTIEPSLTTRVDVINAKTLADKLPKGFPADIPMESTVVSSTSTLYPTKFVTLDAVSYTSSESVQAKYAEYDQFFSTASNGFYNETKTASSTQAVLQATRPPTEILVVITPQATGSLVQIALTIHQ
jgi:hypothetical protein